tara:strand:+ start:14686 stop:15417 length:732 start_codon:yes stop_codon:yes gene_type:complete
MVLRFVSKTMCIISLVYLLTASAFAEEVEVEVDQCPLSCVGKPPAIEPESPEVVFKDKKAIDVYTESELLNYIRREWHLNAIRRDECQIVDDIRANAEVLKLPTFQFLWGEMLIYGVCIRKNISYGVHWLRSAVRQGLPEAMLKLARYYQHSDFVIPNYDKSVRLAYLAAQAGSTPSRIFLVELFLAGHGHAADHAKAYDWLYHTSFHSSKMKRKSEELLSLFAQMLPPSVVYQIQNRSNDEF